MKLKSFSGTSFFFILTAVLVFIVGVFSAEAAPVKKGGTLKVGFGMTAVKLDPHDASGSGDVYMMAQIYERLLYFRLNKKTQQPEPIPCLATKWEFSPDKMSMTFTLRKDVQFADGTPFNAEAVKFNIDRLLGPPVLVNTNRYAAMIKDCEVIGPYTVKVNLKVPAVAIESFFVQSYIGMISPTAVKKWGDKIGTHPVGTGPYQLKEWLQGEKVVLEANKKHWKGMPNLDKIEFIFVPESVSRMNMLNSGQVDLAFNLDIPDLEKVKKEGKFDVVEWPTSELLYLTLNNLAKPTNETAVRQAIKLAIDRKTIVQKVLLGHGALADSYIAKTTWGSHPVDRIIFDPEKAKKILTNAGWIPGKDGIREKGGEKLTLKIRFPSGRYPMCDEVVAIIQNQLNSVGFNCLTEKMGFGAWITSLQLPKEKATGDSYIVSWSSKEDAYWAVTPMSSNSPLSFYQNQEVQKLLADQLVTWDKAKRKGILKKIQEIANEEAFGVNVFFMNYNIVSMKKVHGVQATTIPSSDFFNVLNVWME